jgi:hypothetical protein
MLVDDLDNNWYGKERTEEEQERSLRLGALCRVYEQADRVLTGDPLIVNVMPDGPAPAWSDGAAIYINQNEIEDMDLETLTQVTGLNYHELAHHFYTPRKGTDLIKWVIENQYMESTNILEDQRIETLLVARYPSVAPYLTATVARWLSGSPEEAAGNYVLVRGRRYLPVEIRQAFRDEFAFPDLIPTIIEIVDEYRVLAFPRDYARARVLIERFNDEVLKPLQLDGHDLSGGPNGCGKRDPISKGRPEPGKAQERDAARAKGMGKAESPYIPKPKQNKADGGSTNTNNPDHNDNEQQSTMPVPQSAADALKLRELTQQQNTPPSIDAGSGHHESKGGVPNNINDMLNNAIDDVLARKDVQADIKAKQRVIVGGDGKYDDAAKTGKFDLTDVPQETTMAYRIFARELERLRDECEPTWVKETPSGRLNVQRIINGCEIDAAFDRWEEGTDGADVEAVILVDRSGSMSSGNNDRNASLACWTIKRALENIDSPVTVYAFDDQNEVAYKRSEQAHKTKFKFIYGNGGTNPYSALLAAEQLLMSSRKKNKMLFIVTDGVFDNDKNDEVIRRISSRGILTAMTLIMNDRDYEYYQNNYGQNDTKFRHDAEIYGRISTARDLVPFAKAVVLGAIRKRRR